MKPNPWSNRLRAGWSDAELDEIIRIHAKPIALGDKSVEHDQEILRSAFMNTFLPNSKIRKLIRAMVAVGDSFASLNYENQDWIVRVIHDPDVRKVEPLPAICFTGLAGCGKSALLLAVRRLIDHVVCADLPGHHGFELRPSWFLSLKKGLAMCDLLGPHVGTKRANAGQSSDSLGAGYCNVSPPKRVGAWLDLARRISWRNGICLIFVDEWQFVTQSNANAQATRILLQLMEIGPRLIYGCNYSLGHKLKRRNQEDRDRLLSRYFFLDPENASTDDWKDFLSELKKTAPHIFTFNVDEVELEIHQLTFGIRRATIELLVVAYGEARQRSKNPEVSIHDIRRAYRSADYTVHREDVEVLFEQKISGRKIRDDLWCPFDRCQEPDVVAALSRASEGHDRHLEQVISEQFLTKDERATLPPVSMPKAPPISRKNVLRLRGSKTLKQELLDGAEEFENF